MSHHHLLNVIIEAKTALRDMALQHYASVELISWRWWTCIALLTIPIIIWWLNGEAFPAKERKPRSRC